MKEVIPENPKPHSEHSEALHEPHGITVLSTMTLLSIYRAQSIVHSLMWPNPLQQHPSFPILQVFFLCSREQGTYPQHGACCDRVTAWAVPPVVPTILETPCGWSFFHPCNLDDQMHVC